QRWRMAGGGFLTVGRYFNFNPYDILDDRIDVITRGFLGLTASCARCHDHKYDPIPSADYYSLYGILNSSYLPHHSRLPLLVEPNEPSEAEAQYVAEMNERTAAFEKRFDQLHHQIEDELRKFAADYLVYIVQESVRHRLGETNPVFTERTYLRAPTAYGYGAVRRWRNYIDSRSEHDPVFGIWKRMDSFDKTEFAAAFAEQLHAWHGNTAWKQQLADSPPESMVELARRLGQLFESIDQQWKTFVSHHPDANRLPDDASEQLRQSLMGPGSPTVLTPLESVDCYQLDEHVELRNLQGKIEELTVDFPDAAARAMLLRDRDEPVEPNVFLRGQPDRLGSDVDRHVPTLLLASLADDAETKRSVVDEFAIHRGSGRMELAKSIIDRRNPLTARVIVNRMWQWHFGQALVDSMDDFGSRSQPPTHPELLDYLAWWLMEHDWSLKELNRLMVSSHTFCQSNSSRTDAMQMDPANQLYWRFVPRRAEWEVIRDSLLAVSGRLDQKRNGPSIPLSPDDLDATCRTIFLRIDRQHASGFATNFDFPVPDMTVGKRPITSVPQQQLFFLNSPFVRKQAEALAGTVVQFDGKTDNAKIDWLFQKLFAREPTDTERSAVIDYRQNVSRALSADAPVDAELSEMESWIRTAHALLQLNELIYVP
ncbi:MAG: DUF1553 domain-containing protein, partial [Planctomycetales bacterium]|nr:DUF1553 domain-containing protein [Planctomycetales bacterium]